MKTWQIILVSFFALTPGLLASAQESSDTEQPTPIPLQADIGEERSALARQPVTFDISRSVLPEDALIQAVTWDFGDGHQGSGEKTTHTYARPGTYTVKAKITTNSDSAEDTTTIRIFNQAAILIADSTAPEEQIALHEQQAAQNGLWLLVLRAKGGGPEVLVEEELARQLLDVRETVGASDLIITWTSGGVGANVLSKVAQHLRQTGDLPSADLGFSTKGIVMISETPFAVLAPIAQSTFDQLQPAYVLLTRPAALELLTKPLATEEIRTTIFNSPLEHRVLGSFSARTVRDIGLTNFMSFGVNFLVNRGVPINNIILILMLPVIATILSFSRQVIGIKAFGLITPAMTALSFLVLGLKYGLLVFAAVLAAGTLTRLLVRKLHLLYLPRMALVLTSVTIAVLLLSGIGVATNNVNVLGFSIFPILILMLLAEEFISVQFTAGAKQALTITAWTLALAIACYFIVSWELLRTLVLSYPEITLLAIPLNVAIGRFTGLRVTEYIRFRKLLRPTSSP